MLLGCGDKDDKEKEKTEKAGRGRWGGGVEDGMGYGSGRRRG